MGPNADLDALEKRNVIMFSLRLALHDLLSISTELYQTFL